MAALDQLFKDFAGTNVLVIGDVMVDAYLWGRVERISPEAPVPVVRVTSSSARLGGAANVALNVKALGATPIIASVCGDDENAAKLAYLLGQEGMSADGLIRSAQRRTTVKTRVISGHQHIVRVDEETDDDLGKSDEEMLVARVGQLIAKWKPGVIILEDYNKGVLTARAIEQLIALAKKTGVPVAVDPKKKNFFAYNGVDLFKPNLKELREGLKIDIEADDRGSVRQAIARLENTLGNRISLVTLSEHGMVAHAGSEEHFSPAHTREIADVSGAGDTVIATAALCLAQRTPLRTLAELSNLAGGLVCEHVGVVPIDRDRLRAEAAALMA
jgi:rfaE bifunctional protein kinase chain/domain